MPRSPTIVSNFCGSRSMKARARRAGRLRAPPRPTRPAARSECSRRRTRARGTAPARRVRRDGASRRAADRPQIAAIDPHAPLVGIDQPQQQVRNRRLAAAARSDDRQRFTRLRRRTTPAPGPARRGGTTPSRRQTSPRRGVGPRRASGDSLTSTGSSRICDTRRSDTRTVARFAYIPISACSGGITRI